MKTCTKCGENFNDETDYCIKCGIKLQYANENKNVTNNEQLEWIGIDMDERIVAKIGNGYFRNIVTSGGISKVNAFLTQKRLYLSGKTYEISKGILTSYKVSKVINIEDVTGTGFVYISNIKLILVSILFFILFILSIFRAIFLLSNDYEPSVAYAFFLILAIAFLVAFLVNQKSIFKIEYAGGSIGFDVKWLDINESIFFQKKIYQVKDQRKKELLKEALNEKDKENV